MLPAGLADVLSTLDAPPRFADRAKRLSARYRADGGADGPVFTDDHDRTAYALTRMPATSAAIAKALEYGGIGELSSMVDIGTGTGAGLWAAASRLKPGARVVGVDRDSGLLALARRLATAGPEVLHRAILLDADLSQPRDFGRADLVLLSYLCGELSDTLRPEVLRRAWSATGRWLVVVEPGTPRGFQTILALRRSLITAGASIRAPCTHRRKCPLADVPPSTKKPKPGEAPGWCHHSVRLPRSAAHRAGKGGSLGYEDETYCYLVAERAPADDVHDDIQGRVVAPPRLEKATCEFPLCTSEGLKPTRVTNRMGDAWKRAKSLAWGDSFPLT
jgi:ribosomal protein RSM22 (predicted rRNA methylase)